MSTLCSMTDQVCQKKGCINSRFFQAIDNENCINLEETWEDRASLNTHFRSDVFSALLGAVTLLCETYEIRINNGSHNEGMAIVNAARENQM